MKAAIFIRKMTFMYAFAVLGATLWSSAATAQLTFPREKVLASIGDPKNENIRMEGKKKGVGLVATQSVTQPGAKSLRLHFSFDTVGEHWVILVRSANNRVRWTGTSNAVAGNELWSDEMAGSQFIVELVSTIPDNPVRLTIDRLIVAQPAAAALSHTGKNQMKSIKQVHSHVSVLGRSVVRLRFVADNDKKAYVCSGFLVSSSLVMTNEHCISSDREMRSALIDFDYDSLGSQPSVTLRAMERIPAKAKLDYALLRLEQSVLQAPLPLSTEKVGTDGLPLMIIEHPGGRPKMVSIEDCRVSGVLVPGLTDSLTDFGHECDTEGGSSGSPAIDRTSQKVVGLHHLGFDGDSKLLVNRATHLSVILKDMDNATRAEIVK